MDQHLGGMSFGSSRTAARVMVCALLLVSATALTVADRRDGVDVTADLPTTSGTVTSRSASLVSATMTRLDPLVHPAADPLLGVLWTVSHRLIMPVAGVAATDLVDTFTQMRGADRRHEAIDIRAPGGTPVLAVTDGVVLRLAEHDSGGITLYLLAPDDQTVFYYAHLMKYAEGIDAGVAVRQGDVIGYVGDTGNAGPGNYHLHFEVMTAPDPQHYWAGRPRNPYPLLLRTRG